MVRSFRSLAIASALLVALVSNASAITTASGTLSAVVLNTSIVDLGTTVGDGEGSIVGATALVLSSPAATGVFSGLSFVSLLSFDYDIGAMTDPILFGGDLQVFGATINSVDEERALTNDLVTLAGTGTLKSASNSFLDTEIFWQLDASSDIAGNSVFVISTEGDLIDGGGAGAGPAVPEPSAALVFGIGLVLVGRAAGKRRR